MAKSLVEEKSFLFAVRIVRLYQYLIKSKREFVLSKQILRCGTSVGANVSEAQQGFSKKDFVSKLGIALKEANETMYWLRLLKETGYLSNREFESAGDACVEIVKMLASIIKTSRNSLNNP